MPYIGNAPGLSSQRIVSTFTATAGQTAFQPVTGYSIGYVDVYLNGVRLVENQDYTATDGINVTLLSGAAVGDSVELVAYLPRGLTDGYTKLEADARYAQEGANSDITSMSGITGGVGTPDYVDFDTAATITPAVGRLGWDADTGSLQMGMAGGNVSTHVGQTMHAYVTNAESVTINKGQAVYLYQAQGDRATVKLANNVSDATSAKTLGLAAENIGANQTGYVICQGVLNNVNTAAFNAGDTLYLGSTAGALTATKPVAPNHMVYIGVVERANAGAGQIYVRTQNGYELDEIHDVLITSVSDGHALVYESATNLWKNKAIANSVAGKTGAVTLTNSDVGLGNVENKSSATIRGELTSANVTTALGYTPYNSTNPSGYTSNTGTVTSVSGTGTVSGLTLTGSVTTSGSLTLGGTLSLTSGNVTTALGYTPPQPTGTGASGTWGISISGNAATATTATNVTAGMPNNTDNYMNFRVMRNSNTSVNSDGMFIGYGNANSGATRIYGAGSTSGHAYIDASGNWIRSDGAVYIRSDNIGSYASGGTPTLNVTSSTSFTAVASNHYVLVGGATTVTLPASPAAGAVVWVTVGNGRVDNVIARNGQNINSLAENMTIDQANAGIQLRYADATRGWIFT